MYYSRTRVLMLSAATGLALAMPGMASAAETPGSEGVAIEEVVVTARKTSETAQSVPISLTTVTAQALQDLTVRDIIDIQRVTPGLQIQSQGSSGRAKLTIRGQSEADNRLTQDGSVGVYVDGVNLARNYGLRSSLVDIAQIEVLRGPQGTLFGRNTTGGALNITTQHPKPEFGGYVDVLYGSYDNRQLLGVLNVPLVKDQLAARFVAQRIKRDGYGHNLVGQDIGDDDVLTLRGLLQADPTERVSMLFSSDYTRVRQNGPTTRLLTDAMLANANTSTRSLGSIAAELGLNPNSAADRLTAYNRWRVFYDRAQTGNFYDNSAGGTVVDNVDHWGLSANIKVDLGGVDFRSITAYRDLHKFFVGGDAGGSPFSLIRTGPATTDQHIFSQEVQLSAIDGAGLDWQVGAFYSRETGNEFSTSNQFTYVNLSRARITDGDIKQIGYAAFGQAVYNFSDEFRVTAGVRYSKDDRSLDSHNRQDPRAALPPVLAFPPVRCNLLTPSLGGPVYPDCSYKVSTSADAVTWLISTDWRPTKELMLYGSVSTGYRSGGFAVTGSNAVQPSQAALDAAYTPFEPEFVTNYEVGFKSDLLDRRLRINGAVFYQDYKDIQVQVRGVDNGLIVTRYRNAAKATLYGGELEVTARPTSALTLTAAAAYLHARYDEFKALNAAGTAIEDLSAQPFSSPKWTFNYGATYEIPLKSGAVRLSANYAWTDDVNLAPEAASAASVTQKAYGLLDARISWTVESAQIELAIFGKNLTDEDYLVAATNAESAGFNFGFTGAPRTIGVEIRKTF